MSKLNNTEENVRCTNFPSITIGVITHKARFNGLSSFLTDLLIPIQEYQNWSGMPIELLIVNNSGKNVATELYKITSNIPKSPSFSNCVIHSTQNNIAIGRNLVLQNAKYTHIALIDDDEIPTKKWLIELVKIMVSENCAAVSGPVYPIYPENTTEIVKSIDLHNTIGRRTGDELRATATCNVLIDTSKIGNLIFDEKYGRSGGSDTEFFMRVTDTSEKIIWASRAIVHENIEPNRATVKFMLRRAISQGSTYYRIMSERGDIKWPFIFLLKSLLVACGSLIIAGFYLISRNQQAGIWLKRAFANIGCLKSPTKHLYD